MYKFLVVDDEEIVRRGFREKIAWEEAGFIFLEPCKNGHEAIEMIAQEHPDVVMTDICMPLVDGLEVADYVAKQHPDTLVLILSGYDEFEYARSALRSGVVDYLLKPITSRELSALVSKLKMRLDEHAKRRSAVMSDDLAKSQAAIEPPQPHNPPTSRGWPVSKAAEVQAYIEHNFAQKKLSLEDISRDLFISPGYISHLIKQYVGKTFVDALTELRIEKAKQLLTDSDLKTYEVANAVGFSDPHYFSTTFKKVVGITPSEYRDTAFKSEQA
jgi:two-component system, response regulator YesN